MLDVIIVGGGPAGLSAALILGRCRRRVLVCDSGKPRNAASHALHGFLTRDGIPPRELLRIGREQLGSYPTVEFREATVAYVRYLDGTFEATLHDGSRLAARRLVLATGLIDELPSVPGIEAFYGVSVHHCPYCDGWEWRDHPLAAFGNGVKGLEMAQRLTAWSRDVILCTHGPAELDESARRELDRARIPVYSERIVRLEGRDGRLERLILEDGRTLDRHAIFFSTGSPQRSGLAKALGCELDPKGNPEVGDHGTTCVPGLYVAGDASKDLQLAIFAAAEGAAAAAHLNASLTREDLQKADHED